MKASPDPCRDAPPRGADRARPLAMVAAVAALTFSAPSLGARPARPPIRQGAQAKPQESPRPEPAKAPEAGPTAPQADPTKLPDPEPAKTPAAARAERPEPGPTKAPKAPLGEAPGSKPRGERSDEPDPLAPSPVTPPAKAPGKPGTKPSTEAAAKRKQVKARRVFKRAGVELKLSYLGSEIPGFRLIEVEAQNLEPRRKTVCAKLSIMGWARNAPQSLGQGLVFLELDHKGRARLRVPVRVDPKQAAAMRPPWRLELSDFEVYDFWLAHPKAAERP